MKLFMQRAGLNFYPFVFITLLSGLLFSQAAYPSIKELQINNDAAQVLKSGKQAYALVVRPLDVTQQRIDLVTLNAQTMAPIARSELATVRCARLHAAGNGDVLCLSNNTLLKGKHEFGAPFASVYNRDLSKSYGMDYELSASGISRARISPDGKYQAWTYFVRGHNYMDAGSGQFSTLTQIRETIQAKSGEKTSLLHNLEKWPLTHQGTIVSTPDLNYWGVTFNPKCLVPQSYM